MFSADGTLAFDGSTVFDMVDGAPLVHVAGALSAEELMDGPVADFSPDDRLLAVPGSLDTGYPGVRIHAVMSGAVVTSLEWPVMSFPSVEFDRDSSRLLGWSREQAGIVWSGQDFGTAMTVARLSLPRAARSGLLLPRSAAGGFAPDGMAVAANGGVFAAADGRLLAAVPNTGGLAWLGTGDRVAVTVGRGGTATSTPSPVVDVEILSISSGAAVSTLDRPVRALTFGSPHARYATPDGSLLVAILLDGSAAIFDTSSGRTVALLVGAPAAFVSATFSPDGGKLVTLSADGTIRIWTVA